jgi:hypothetical protein
MKLAARIIGVALILLGVVLAPVGLGLLPLGGMGGQIIWTGWGAFAIAFGAGFLVWAARDRPTP